MRTNMRKAGRLVRSTFEYLENILAAGITTNDLDAAAHDYIISNGGKPAPLGYNGFPKSICTSINNVIAHGIPDDTLISPGDILRLDISLSVNKCFADSCRTYVIPDPTGETTYPDKSLFVDQVRQIHHDLLEWVGSMAPNITTGDIGYKTYQLISQKGFYTIPEFGGHGIGTSLHQQPFVPSLGAPGTGSVISPGTYLAIEPIVCREPSSMYIDVDGWSAISPEGVDTAQFEHTVFFKRDGIEIIT